MAEKEGLAEREDSNPKRSRSERVLFAPRLSKTNARSGINRGSISPPRPTPSHAPSGAWLGVGGGRGTVIQHSLAGFRSTTLTFEAAAMAHGWTTLFSVLWRPNISTANGSKSRRHGSDGGKRKRSARPNDARLRKSDASANASPPSKRPKATLRRDARAWREAADIRAYVEAVSKAANAPETTEAWARWALLEAERVDPIVSAERFRRSQMDRRMNFTRNQHDQV